MNAIINEVDLRYQERGVLVPQLPMGRHEPAPRNMAWGPCSKGGRAQGAAHQRRGVNTTHESAVPIVIPALLPSATAEGILDVVRHSQQRELTDVRDGSDVRNHHQSLPCYNQALIRKTAGAARWSLLQRGSKLEPAVAVRGAQLLGTGHQSSSERGSRVSTLDLQHDN